MSELCFLVPCPAILSARSAALLLLLTSSPSTELSHTTILLFRVSLTPAISSHPSPRSPSSLPLDPMQASAPWPFVQRVPVPVNRYPMVNFVGVLSSSGEEELYVRIEAATKESRARAVAAVNGLLDLATVRLGSFFSRGVVFFLFSFVPVCVFVYVVCRRTSAFHLPFSELCCGRGSRRRAFSLL